MKKLKKSNAFLLIFLFLSCSGDEVDYYPKPRGYMRLDFPERDYTQYESECAYTFEIPDYFTVVNKKDCNRDILINRFNASLFLTYIPVDTNLNMNIEYAQKLVYDHSVKADEIQAAMVRDPKREAYGMKYNIVGNAASPFQFYLTDSSDHFLRGALYFNVRPNYDSIKPSLDYIVHDIEHMIETVEWTEADTLDD